MGRLTGKDFDGDDKFVGPGGIDEGYRESDQERWEREQQRERDRRRRQEEHKGTFDFSRTATDEWRDADERDNPFTEPHPEPAEESREPARKISREQVRRELNARSADFGLTPQQMLDMGMHPDGTPFDCGPASEDPRLKMAGTRNGNGDGMDF